jgi:hypothetical protein
MVEIHVNVARILPTAIRATASLFSVNFFDSFIMPKSQIDKTVKFCQKKSQKIR